MWQFRLSELKTTRMYMENIFRLIKKKIEFVKAAKKTHRWTNVTSLDCSLKRDRATGTMRALPSFFSIYIYSILSALYGAVTRSFASIALERKTKIRHGRERRNSLF